MSGSSRTAGRGPAEIDDPSIPLLTDRIYLPALDLDIGVPGQKPPPGARPIVLPTRAAVSEAGPAVDVLGDIGAAPLPPMPPETGVEPAPAVVPDLVVPLQVADLAPARRDLTDDEGPIETELDRDLVAELDADFEALLAADAEPDREAASGSVEPPTPAAAAIIEARTVEVIGEPALPVETGDAAATVGLPPPTVLPTDRQDATVALPAAVDMPAAGIEPAADIDLPAGEATAPEATALDQRAPDNAVAEAVDAQAEALRAAVLQAVAQQVPARIDAVVRERMQPSIEAAMARLGEEAQAALRVTLQELVDQVLREQRNVPPPS